MGADHILRDDRGLFRKAAQISGANYSRGAFGNEILLGGFDVVYDSIGNDRSIGHSLRLAKGGGNVVVLGINFKPGKIDYTPIWNQEIHVTGINCHASESTGQTSFDMAARLLAKKRFPADGLLTHRFPMDRYREAVKAFLSKGRSRAIKIVLDHKH